MSAMQACKEKMAARGCVAICFLPFEPPHSGEEAKFDMVGLCPRTDEAVRGMAQVRSGGEVTFKELCRGGGIIRNTWARAWEAKYGEAPPPPAREGSR